VNETEPMQPIPERIDGDGTTLGSRRSPALTPFLIGIPLLLIALFFQTVTVVSGDYVKVVLIAVGLTVVADVCFIYALVRGGIFARCLSVFCLLPTLFVIADFVRRSGAGN
jgi:drug/metabolite transporter (DMT)-like permease